MNETFWVWDFIFTVVFPGIGLGLLGLVAYRFLSYLFCWLKCCYGDRNDENKEEEK